MMLGGEHEVLTHSHSTMHDVENSFPSPSLLPILLSIFLIFVCKGGKKEIVTLTTYACEK